MKIKVKKGKEKQLKFYGNLMIETHAMKKNITKTQILKMVSNYLRFQKIQKPNEYIILKKI